MSVGIIKYKGVNPFEEYPQLRDIWPEPFNCISEEAVVEHLGLMGQVEIGDIFVVTNDSRVIGISGYFPFDEVTADLGLRWHGIVPDERGKGYSKEVLGMVAERAMERFPQASHLIELVPLTEYGKPLEKHFTKCGFLSHGEPETYDWSDIAWQPYRILLAALAGTKMDTPD